MAKRVNFASLRHYFVPDFADISLHSLHFISQVGFGPLAFQTIFALGLFSLEQRRLYGHELQFFQAIKT